MDSSIGMNLGQDVTQSMPNSNFSSESHINNVSKEEVSEKTFTQNEVNEIVKQRMERDRRVRTEQPEYFQQKYSQGNAHTQEHNARENQNFSNQSNINDDKIRQIVAEEARRQREEFEKQTAERNQKEQAKVIVNKFLNKVEAGKNSYEDFDSVTGDIEFVSFPNTVQLLAEYVDNVADVLYDLGKNRFKMAQIESLCYMSPKDAIKEVQRLASSIKENKEASRVKFPNEPLSQMRPSTTGTDNGGMSQLSDLKRRYRV